MAFGVKTNEGAVNGIHEPGERPGSRAQVKFVRMSAFKARQVIDLIRGKDAAEADAILRFSERDAARVIRKCLASAVANAAHNDELDPEALYVSACFVDEGMTIKRFKPRARGRATRIRKRTCHITVIVSPLSPAEQERRRIRDAARDARGVRRTRTPSQDRAARVARSRGAAPAEAPTADEVTETETVEETTASELPAEGEGVTEAEATVDEAIGAEDEPEVEADEASAEEPAAAAAEETEPEADAADGEEGDE
jgi:large subunit ribosomal protein L22